MAVIHNATISPTKPELLAQWVPTQPWGAAGFDVVGAYRFDDPDGAVGIETHLLRTPDGHVLQVPVTYRDAALAGAEQYLICTMEHSVLGQRWVYDAAGDPVYARALAAAVVDAVPQAELVVDDAGSSQVHEPDTRVQGSGTSLRAVPPIETVVSSSDASATTVEAGDLRLVVRRRVDLAAQQTGGAPTLTGVWQGQDTPALLAWAE